MSCVPFVTLEPGSSRHLPEAGWTSVPLVACHCWLLPPLQVHNSIRVPLLKLAPVMSMQPPSMVRVPLLLTVQFCAEALPSQSHICTLLPLAPLPLLLSTHLELLRPDTIGPGAPPPREDGGWRAAPMLAWPAFSVAADGYPEAMTLS